MAKTNYSGLECIGVSLKDDTTLTIRIAIYDNSILSIKLKCQS